MEPESYQADFRGAGAGSVSDWRDAVWLQEEPGSQARAEPRSCRQDRSWGTLSHTAQPQTPPGKCCCFDPSSRERAQMKLKQVLIKTRTILQTGLLITVNICQGKLRRKIVISCATCHFHLITITLFCRAKTSVLHNKLLSWGLV